MTTQTITLPKRHPDLTTRLLPDGYVLVYSEKSTWVHTLTPLGGLVWEFCDGENSAEKIAELISSTAQVPANSDDVLKLIKEFQEKNLLTAADH